MLELMAFDETQPLYMQVIQQILREMRLSQQRNKTPFSYAEFIRRLDDEPLMPGQKPGLQQRLDTLQSFMVPEQVQRIPKKSRATTFTQFGTDWTPMVSVQSVPNCVNVVALDFFGI